MSTSEVTTLLQAWSQGNETARDGLASLVYADLCRLARGHLRGWAAPTLDPGDLVHEVFIRLLGQEARWVNRAHFFSVASVMIRRVLVDRARARRAGKRGGWAVRVDLAQVDAPGTPEPVDLLALEDALEELAALDSAQARVVELRFFGGLTHEKIAEVLGTSVATAKRRWASARLWLYWRLQAQGPAALGTP